jgi:hypothetical protein
MSDRWSGYIVGTVNDPGECEKCHRTLHRGERAAISYPLAIHCLPCAREPEKYTEYEDWALPAIASILFLLVLAFGIAG